MSETKPSRKKRLVHSLISLDAQEAHPVGQLVNETYPMSDFFVGDRLKDRKRVVKLLFGEHIAPSVGEFAMYVAHASRARSLSAGRKVGAALVVGESVVATGYNDVPPGQASDVRSGVDTSEVFKRDNVGDTVRRLREAGMLKSKSGDPHEKAVERALTALKGGHLLSVIEYQRSVHAEAKTLDDAATRGVSPVGGNLYVTTFPCHLCYKHCLSTRLASVRYIDPYPKSRATAMYPACIRRAAISVSFRTKASPRVATYRCSIIGLYQRRIDRVDSPSGRGGPLFPSLARYGTISTETPKNESPSANLRSSSDP